jgi:hypothetical protein
MNGGFDFGIIILGLGTLAFLAGLGAWIWEILNKPKNASTPPTRPDSHGKSLSAAAETESVQPEVVRTSIVSKFLMPPPTFPIFHQPEEPSVGDFKAQVDTVEADGFHAESRQERMKANEALAPAEKLERPQEPAVEEFELEAKTVEADETYAESLQEQVEVDKPFAPVEAANEPEEPADDTILTCSGRAIWASPENDKDNSTINRAIFRNYFNSLILAFNGFSSHKWPREILFKRETEKRYTGIARHENISVHCTITFQALYGKNLEFTGWWQADRRDNNKHLKYRFSGILEPLGRIPLPPAALRGIPLTPRAIPASEPVVPHQITIPQRSFSLGSGRFLGKPFIEILENGRPWGETHRNAKKHFSFGSRKARMILLAEKQIREFVDSDGEAPKSSPTRVQDGLLLDDPVVITREDSFTIGSTRISLPHIKLTHRNESIGFGLSKADALLTLWAQIERWAKKN